MQLYYHKTDGGAEYLTSNFILAGKHKEGSFNSKFIVRIDGDITKDAELTIKLGQTKEDYTSRLIDLLESTDNLSSFGISASAEDFMSDLLAELNLK